MTLNYLLVEGDSDKEFFQRISQIQNFEIKKIEKINASNLKKILDSIDLIKNEAKKEFAKSLQNKHLRIGLILDSDYDLQLKENLLSDLAKELSIVFNTISHDKLKGYGKANFENDIQVDFGYYLTNVDGKGELENLLFQMAKKKSCYSECLESWRSCINLTHSKTCKGIDNKEFYKTWLQVYLRYDICGPKTGNIEKKCSFKELVKNDDLWDWDHECLNDVNEFFNKLFKNE